MKVVQHENIAAIFLGNKRSSEALLMQNLIKLLIYFIQMTIILLYMNKYIPNAHPR